MIFKNKPWIPIILLIVTFAISVSVSAYEKVKFENWTTTTGIVTHTREIKHRARRSLVSDELVIYYDYSVNGKKYEGISSYMYIDDDKYLVGESYQIWYNPDNHEESTFLNPYKASVAYFPFTVAFISVCLYLIVFLGTKKKARK